MKSKFFKNSAWALAEQVFRMITGLVVGVYIARQLGPSDFGALNYALAFSALGIATCRLGMESILVREIISGRIKTEKLVSTSFYLMLAASLLFFVLAITSAYFFETENAIRLAIIILSTAPIFTAFSACENYFQSQLKTKISARLKMMALAISSLVKIALVTNNASLHLIVTAYLLEYLLLAIFLVIAFKQNSTIKITRNFERGIVKDLLRSSLPMLIAAAAGIFYTRIDQFMLRWLLDLQSVGIYAAASKIYEAWIVFPYVLTISLIPMLANLKKSSDTEYESKFILLFRSLFWLSIVVAILTTLLSEYLVTTFFGSNYRESAGILNVLIWSSAFSAIGSVGARYFNLEKMEKKIMYRAVTGAVIKITLNYYLITAYGAIGAAYSTLACAIFIYFIMDFSDKKTKKLSRIKLSAIIFFPRKWITQ